MWMQDRQAERGSDWHQGQPWNWHAEWQGGWRDDTSTNMPARHVVTLADVQEAVQNALEEEGGMIQVSSIERAGFHALQQQTAYEPGTGVLKDKAMDVHRAGYALCVKTYFARGMMPPRVGKPGAPLKPGEPVHHGMSLRVELEKPMIQGGTDLSANWMNAGREAAHKMRKKHKKDFPGEWANFKSVFPWTPRSENRAVHQFDMLADGGVAAALADMERFFVTDERCQKLKDEGYLPPWVDAAVTLKSGAVGFRLLGQTPNGLWCYGRVRALGCEMGGVPLIRVYMEARPRHFMADGYETISFEQERKEPASLVEVAGPFYGGLKECASGTSYETAYVVCVPGEFDERHFPAGCPRLAMGGVWQREISRRAFLCGAHLLCDFNRVQLYADRAGRGQSIVSSLDHAADSVLDPAEDYRSVVSQVDVFCDPAMDEEEEEPVAPVAPDAAGGKKRWADLGEDSDSGAIAMLGKGAPGEGAKLAPGPRPRRETAKGGGPRSRVSTMRWVRKDGKEGNAKDPEDYAPEGGAGWEKVKTDEEFKMVVNKHVTGSNFGGHVKKGKNLIPVRYLSALGLPPCHRLGTGEPFDAREIPLAIPASTVGKNWEAYLKKKDRFVLRRYAKEVTKERRLFLERIKAARSRGEEMSEEMEVKEWADVVARKNWTTLDPAKAEDTTANMAVSEYNFNVGTAWTAAVTHRGKIRDKQTRHKMVVKESRIAREEEPASCRKAGKQQKRKDMELPVALEKYYVGGGGEDEGIVWWDNHVRDSMAMKIISKVAVAYSAKLKGTHAARTKRVTDERVSWACSSMTAHGHNWFNTAAAMEAASSHFEEFFQKEGVGKWDSPSNQWDALDMKAVKVMGEVKALIQEARQPRKSKKTGKRDSEGQLTSGGGARGSDYVPPMSPLAEEESEGEDTEEEEEDTDKLGMEVDEEDTTEK